MAIRGSAYKILVSQSKKKNKISFHWRKENMFILEDLNVKMFALLDGNENVFFITWWKEKVFSITGWKELFYFITRDKANVFLIAKWKDKFDSESIMKAKWFCHYILYRRGWKLCFLLKEKKIKYLITEWEGKCIYKYIMGVNMHFSLQDGMVAS